MKNPAPDSASTRAYSQWAGVAVGLIFLAFLGYLFRDRLLNGRNDFVQLYAGARLSGTPELYDPSASERIHFEVLGMALKSLYYSRPAFYALLLYPFGLLPYSAAYWTYQTISLGALVAFLWMWSRKHPGLILFTSLCIPVMANFVNGQDVTFALLAAALSIVAMRKNHDILAGLLLAFCAIKVHLFALTPIVLLINRRWKVLEGGFIGGSILMAASCWRDGWDWPLRYMRLLENPELHPGPDVMPTLHGLIYGAIGRESLPLEIVLSVAVVLMLIVITRQSSLEFAMACALIGGLLVGYHAYLHDCVLLLLPLVLILEQSDWPPLRVLIVLTISPPVFIALMSGRPWNMALPMLLILLLALACTRPAKALPALA